MVAEKLTRCVAILLVLVLAGCDGPNPLSKLGKPNMTPLSPRLQKLFEKTKPVCFGRFVIDVPVGTEIGWGPVHVDAPIISYPGQAHMVGAEIKAKLDEYAAQKHKTEPSMLVAVREGPNRQSKIVVGYESQRDKYTVQIDAYISVPPHAFVIAAKPVIAEEWQTAVADFSDIASRLRARSEDEVPSEPGICIESGFVAEGEGRYYELISIGFRILPDVHFAVQSIKKDEAVESDSLQEAERRLEKAKRGAEALGLGEEYAKIKWLRRGRREFAGQEAFEYGGRYPPIRGNAHEFHLETPGEPKNPLKPTWDIELDTGAEGDKPGRVRPSLSDEEAVALWDKLLSSIRPRPGAVSTSGRARQ